MTDEELSLTRKIQLKELEILKVFQKICRRHNLRYFAIGGTCLGAIRHKGFIPWDDDIDVGMPYEDYVKFIEAAKTELPENYVMTFCKYARTMEASYCIKLHDSNTSYFGKRFQEYPETVIGIRIDVDPLHGLPKGKIARKFVLKLVRLLAILDSGIRFPYKIRQRLRGKILSILCWPLKLLLPYNFFTIRMENLLKKYPFGCSDEVVFPINALLLGNNGWYKLSFPYEDLKETIEVPFENTTIAVPAGYDRFLTLDYGDYMKLPPEELRFSRLRDMTLDFDRPCSYYRNKKDSAE